MEKVSLPIKTKIAAWLLIFQGVSPFLCGLLIEMCFRCAKEIPTPPYWSYLHPYPHWMHEIGDTAEKIICGISGEGFFGFFFFILFAFFLLKKKKWAWWLSTIGALISIIVPPPLIIIGTWISGAPPSTFLVILIPAIIFILLLLDRKNFWKIAT